MYDNYVDLFKEEKPDSKLKLQKTPSSERKTPKKKKKKKNDYVDLVTPSKMPRESKTAQPQSSVSKKKDRKKGRVRLEEMEIVKSERNAWQILGLIGSGGFGDVYKVRNMQASKMECAMKTEMVAGEKRMLRLKVEVEAMQDCSRAREKKHFVEIQDRGKVDETFKFVVMDLVGSSLEDYRKTVDCDFTKSTVVQVARQSLEALRDLHIVGWLHRDIKPHNFAYGLGEKESIIYIFDFGIAKRIHNRDGEVKKPRSYVKFLGTARFASRNCHRCVEQSRKDDIECWLYLVFDIFDRSKGLPWKKEPVKRQIIVQKDRFFEDKAFFKEYYKKHPLKKLNQVISDLNTLTFYDTPKYDSYRALLRLIAKEQQIDLKEPLDWTVDRKAVKTVEKTEESRLEGSEVEEEEDKGPFYVEKKKKRTKKTNKE